jgi:hypothetical protein
MSEQLKGKNVVRGESFQAVDSLSNVFPKHNIENIRSSLSKALTEMLVANPEYSAVSENINFDSDGLLVGQYARNSLIHIIGLRAAVDIAEFASKLGEGKDFDVIFSIDAKSGAATLTTASKRHPLVQKTLIRNPLIT